MVIKLKGDRGEICLPAEVSEAAVRASAVALRLIILLAADEGLRENYEARANDAAARLGCSRGELDMALAFWCGAGIVSSDGAPDEQAEQKSPPKEKKLRRASEIPEYTSEELGDVLEEDKSAVLFIDEAQRRIGRMFNTREVSMLLGMKNYLELDDNYVYLLIDHCVRLEKTSIRYIEQVAISLYDEGVHDSEALAERLEEREIYKSAEGQFRALVGARGRKLTAKESRFITRWITEMKYSFDMIRLAYEITVDTKGEYNAAYMNGILERWFSSSITTPEQVKAEAEARRSASGKGERAGSQFGSFETDEFFEAALRRSHGE